jgi:cysteine desulfurase
VTSAIYFDYNASTPIHPEVVAAMQPFMTRHWGNPSSGHWASRPAAEALAKARGQVASLVGAQPEEVVFTSGGSEANNWAIKGVLMRQLASRPGSRPHVVVSALEHPSVLAPCRYLEAFGARVTRVPVDGHGVVDLAAVERAIDSDTVLVSVMHAQNEVGTLQPIAAVAALAHRAGALCHSDAAQSLGKVPVRVDALGVDLLTIAGHKLYAPKGIGALYLRQGTAIDPLIHGAGHEAGRRAGTENVLLAVGLGAACALAEREPAGEALRRLRDRFEARLAAALGDRVVVLGHPTERLPNTVNVAFVDRVGADVLAFLDDGGGVAASLGAACHAGSRTVSPVLAAMGVPERIALGAIRFSFGRETTEAELERVVARLVELP